MNCRPEGINEEMERSRKKHTAINAPPIAAATDLKSIRLDSLQFKES
jgi:hypothetical protein